MSKFFLAAPLLIMGITPMSRALAKASTIGARFKAAV